MKPNMGTEVSPSCFVCNNGEPIGRQHKTCRCVAVSNKLINGKPEVIEEPESGFCGSFEPVGRGYVV